MLIHGFHPIRELLRSRPQEVLRILVSARGGARRQEIERLSHRQGVLFEAARSEALDRLTEGAVHNGFVAETSGHSQESGGSDENLVVILEDVQDPRNLGAVLRVCEGAGIGRIYIRDRGSASLTAAVAKTSAGAVEYVQVERVGNTARLIESLHKQEFWVYGADVSGETVWDVDLRGKCALCFGGEGTGLRALTRKRCDGLISVPMRGHVESLNIATAVAAVIYEALRQRLPAPEQAR